MSFNTKKAQAVAPTVALPNPADTENRIATARKRRLNYGGVASTFMGRVSGAALPAPGSTLTGLPGSN